MPLLCANTGDKFSHVDAHVYHFSKLIFFFIYLEFSILQFVLSTIVFFSVQKQNRKIIHAWHIASSVTQKLNLVDFNSSGALKKMS